MKKGDSIALETDTDIQSDDEILWTFGPENRLVVKTDSGKTSIGQKFTGRVELNTSNGSLTIRSTDHQQQTYHIQKIQCDCHM